MPIFAQISVDTISQIEKLTLTSALMVAIWILWKALTKKDDELLKALQLVSSTLAQTNNLNAELKRTIECNTEVQQELVGAIAVLEAKVGNLPCVVAANEFPMKVINHGKPRESHSN